LKAIDKVFKHSPQILHQFTSYLKAKHIFKIKDADVIEAIKWHSVSEKKRSKLDKLLFVSDFSSYDRNFLEASKVRKIAFQNLDKAYKLAKFYKEKDLKERGLPIWRNFF
jgi:HD superfamily phosphohydrolase YqeK